MIGGLVWMMIAGRAGVLSCADSFTEPPAAIELGASDRILVLAPHPDDETLGCGGIIQHCVAMNLPIRIVFFTYGDNNELSFLSYRKHPVIAPSAVRKMGAVRHDEAMEAAVALGVDSANLLFLGYPDFGTLTIWCEHWGPSPPFASMLTHTRSVPYATAYRPGAPYKGEEILRDLTEVIREFKPTKIFVSHPGDYNFDHRGLYLFTQVALWNLQNQLAPELHTYLIHFPRWPAPRGDHPDQPLNPPDLLKSLGAWTTLILTDHELTVKRKAIRCHRSQFEYSANYLLSFMRRNEPFNDIPPIRLSADRGSSANASAPTGAAAETVEWAPEELTPQDRARWLGMEWRTVELQNARLYCSVNLQRSLAEAVSLSVYMFGYRQDAEFDRMPKIHVQIGHVGHAVFDQGRKLAPETVEVQRNRNSITVGVPLSLLGQPEKLLASARAYTAEVPLDWTCWRVIELHGGSADIGAR